MNRRLRRAEEKRKRGKGMSNSAKQRDAEIGMQLLREQTAQLMGRIDILTSRIANVSANLVLSYDVKLKHKSNIITQDSAADDPDKKRINALIEAQELVLETTVKERARLEARLPQPVEPQKEGDTDESNISTDSVPSDSMEGQTEPPATEAE